MAKHVFTNPYHQWAHQSQEYAYNSSRNRSFRGRCAYSYRACIACILDGGIYLVSSERWTVTTAKHQSEVRRAIPADSKVFLVPHMLQSEHLSELSHKENLIHLLGQFHENADKAYRARVSCRWLADLAISAYESALDYRKVFKVKGVTFPKAKYEKLLADRPALEAKTRANDEKRRIEHERYLKELAETEPLLAEYLNATPEERPAIAHRALSAWFDGGPLPRWQVMQNFRYQYMRVKGDNIETTHHAIVPVEHAKRALRLCLQFVKAGVGYTPGKDIRLGAYRLLGIAPDGVTTVGCHRFEKAEVMRIADLLGVA